MGAQALIRLGQAVRVVFDTNVVLSALLFAQGRLAWLRESWQMGRIVPVVSRDTVRELCRVLAYPKFRLSVAEQEELLSDYLPYAQVINIPEDLPALPLCNDPADQKFLVLTHVASAEYLVSGDRDLLQMMDQVHCRILTPTEFKRQWQSYANSPDAIHESPAPQY